MCTHPLVWTLWIIAPNHLKYQSSAFIEFRCQNSYISVTLFVTETIEGEILFCVLAFEVLVTIGILVEFILLLRDSNDLVTSRSTGAEMR